MNDLQNARLKLINALSAPIGCTKLVLTMDRNRPVMVEFTTAKFLESDQIATVADAIVEIQDLQGLKPGERP